MIRLGYEEATEILRVALALPPESRSPFRARIRQLQRLGLLRKPEGRAYERFAYGLVELAALATAFRLMEAFVLPMVAVRLLTERWDDFAPALLAGLGPELAASRWDEGRTQGETFVAVDGTALARLGLKGAADARYDGPLSVRRHAGSATLDQAAAAGLSRGVLLDTRPYMAELGARIRALPTVGDDAFADEVDRLRFGAGRAGEA